MMTRQSCFRAVPAILLFSLLLDVPFSSEAIPLYAGDFEAETVGSYPSPWANLFSGLSAGVSDLRARSGNQSFRSESYGSWARWDYVPLAMVPDHLEYRGSVLVETAGRGCMLGFGYLEPGNPSTGWEANSVWFNNNGRIQFYSRGFVPVDLGAWSPGQWYDIQVRLDYLGNMADVFIDGALVGNDLMAAPKILSSNGTPVPLNQFGFFGENFSGGGTGVQYLDDVSVSAFQPVPEPATLTLLGLGLIGLRWRRCRSRS